MIDRERMLKLEAEREKARMKWESRESQLNRHFQDNEARKNREFQQAMMASRTRKDIWIFGVIVTLFLVVATILAAFIERGFWWEDRMPFITTQSTANTSGSQTASASEQAP